jgi:hypothetical protein
MCPCSELSISAQGLKCSLDGLTAPRRPNSSLVIHRLWINLWITMLIACKCRFYDLGL